MLVEPCLVRRRRRDFKGVNWMAVFALSLTLAFFMATAPAQAADSPSYQSYRTSAGDTLWLLAQRYQTTPAAIQSINGLKGTYLSRGQALLLPVRLRGEAIVYRVQSGDTLYLIGQRTGSSVQSILQRNPSAGGYLYPNQTLLLPATQPGDTLYRVAAGDSLYLIARRFGLTVEQLKNHNGLPSTGLLAGQLLGIPPKASTPAVPVDLPVYRVVPGDNLYTIAQRFKTTEAAIYQTNRLNSQVLMPGQPLYLPPGKEAVTVAGPRGDKRPGYGEFLDWQWARWVFNVGARATLVDLYTQRSFQVYYLGGSNHADVEPLTAADTSAMRGVFGGSWSWSKRPVLVTTAGRTLAASLAGQPHSLDTIATNNVSGHFDLYFWNSSSHQSNTLSPEHQQNVLRAAGRL